MDRRLQEDDRRPADDAVVTDKLQERAGMADTSFDLVIIGGGPGGYVAAIRAAQLGMKTAVVEREHLGGICLNWGCIPTKALLRSSEINHLLHNLDQFGFSAKDIAFDTKKVVERSRKVAKQLSGGVGFLMKKNKVTVFDGTATLVGKWKIAVRKDGNQAADLIAKHIIPATASRATELRRPSASSGTSRISASKAPRYASRRRISWSTSGSPPTSPASMPSAMSSPRRGSPTRRATRASSASRRSPG